MFKKTAGPTLQSPPGHLPATLRAVAPRCPNREMAVPETNSFDVCWSEPIQKSVCLTEKTSGIIIHQPRYWIMESLKIHWAHPLLSLL